MKRLYTILVLLLCMTICHAQPRLRTPEIYIGIHGGVTASTVLFNPTVSHMTPITQACVLGGNGGLVFRYGGHKCCAIQVELNYQHSGWREYQAANEVEGIAESTYSRELHYIELPLLMNLNFGNERCRGFLNLGPQIGYCVFDNHGTGTQLNDSKTHYRPIEQPFDWGVAGGLGVYFRSKNAGLYQLEARFNYSFGGIYGTKLADHFSMASPMDLSINLAWMWEIKKNKRIQNIK